MKRKKDLGNTIGNFIGFKTMCDLHPKHLLLEFCWKNGVFKTFYEVYKKAETP